MLMARGEDSGAGQSVSPLYTDLHQNTGFRQPRRKLSVLPGQDHVSRLLPLSQLAEINEATFQGSR